MFLNENIPCSFVNVVLSIPSDVFLLSLIEAFGKIAFDESEYTLPVIDPGNVWAFEVAYKINNTIKHNILFTLHSIVIAYY